MLYNIVFWFLQYISMNQPYVFICPLCLEPPSHLPPHLTPLCCHRAPYLSSLCHMGNSCQLAINILHVVMYMFQCYSPNSSRLLHTLCPQVCSLCLHFHWVLFLKLFVHGKKTEPIDIVYKYVPSTLLDVYNMTSVSPPYHL